MSELELQKEILKFNLLHPQQKQRTNFTEILGLLIFAFMIVVYFHQNNLQQNHSVYIIPNTVKNPINYYYIPQYTDTFSKRLIQY